MSASRLEVVAAARAAGLTIAEPAVPADRYAEVNGVRLHYLDWGNEALPDLLFIHGLAQQAHSWDFAALALRHQYHVVSLSLRGHGDSDWSTDGKYGLGNYVADVAALIDSARLHRPVICGLSLGGRIAYMLAASRPADVSAIVVVDTAPVIADAARSRVMRFVSAAAVFDTFHAIVESALAYNPRRSKQALIGSLRNSVRQRSDGKWTWKYDPSISTAPPSDPTAQWQALSRVRCPALFVMGEDSDMVSSETLDKVLSTVPGSKAESVSAAGHLVPGDNPAGFDHALRKFLNGLGGRPPVTSRT